MSEGARQSAPQATPPAMPRDPGLYARRGQGPRLAATEIVAAILSVLWLGLLGLIFLLPGAEAPDTGSATAILMVIVLVLPVAMIWIAAFALRTARKMRDETERLQLAIDAMRNAYVAQVQAGLIKPKVDKSPDDIAAERHQTDSAIARFTAHREAAARSQTGDSKVAAAAPKPPPPVEDQPAFALGDPDEAPGAPVPVPDLIQALNFPDDPEDSDGFRALRRALQDRELARLVRSAQDVLTLLSQDGIYMDDLKPTRTGQDIWRKFAQGERGPSISALGGIRDRSPLALTSGRMRQDPVFRDAVHHFLRQFDKCFAVFEKSASDQEVADFAETRTARAFMLLGRVSGSFD